MPSARGGGAARSPTPPSQQNPQRSHQGRMQMQALTAAALALVLLSSAPALAQGAWGRVPGRPSGAADPPPAGEGDGVSGQGSARGGEGEGVAPAGLLLGSARQDRPAKHQPARSRGPRLSHHLRGYGKFNSDTHSCHGIQSRPCQKPSDCDGCLGLYTCKVPRGTCDLKAVSRE